MTSVGTFLTFLQHYIDVVLTPLAWVARKLWGPDPRRPERNIFIGFEFGTIGLLSLATLTGVVPPAPSLAAAPDAFTIISSVCITMGCAIVTVSLCLPGDDGRLILEQLGLAFAGFGFLCYGVALIHLNGWDRALLPASFAFGAAGGTGAVYAQLWWYLRKPWERRRRPVL